MTNGYRTPSGDDGTGEVDRQFRSLLEGLRTSLPGVQVLFAFLLVAPFQTVFESLAFDQRLSYTVSFYSAGLATILMIAPSVHQRVRAPFTGVKRQSSGHLEISVWITIVGTAAMAVAIASTIYLVSSIVYGQGVARLVTAAVALVTGWAWIYVPLVTFRRI